MSQSSPPGLILQFLLDLKQDNDDFVLWIIGINDSKYLTNADNFKI